jgi:hypothetical protein
VTCATLFLLLCIFVFGPFFLITTLHELGHVIAGWLVGFRLSFLLIGPFRIIRKPQGWKVRLTPFLGGGMTCSLPTDTRAVARRMAVMAAGGPLASLLTVVAGMSLLISARADSWLAVFVALTTALSTIFFFLSIMPGYRWGFASDGARLLTLLRGDAAADRFITLTLTTAAQVNGIRPREWDGERLRRATLVEGRNRDDYAAVSFAFYHALDGGDVERAGEYLEKLLALRHLVPRTMQHACLLEAAYFEARCRDDPAAARERLAGVPEEPANACLRLRAEAAILLAEGEKDLAREKAEQALATKVANPSVGTAAAEKEWLGELIALSRS